MTENSFTLKDFIEEIDTLHWERKQFLETKLQKRTIGEPEANLARFRLERMSALAAYLKAIEKFQAGQKPGEGAAQGSPADEQSGETSPAPAVEEKQAPEPETIPLAPELEAEDGIEPDHIPDAGEMVPAPALDDWE